MNKDPRLRTPPADSVTIHSEGSPRGEDPAELDDLVRQSSVHTVAEDGSTSVQASDDFLAFYGLRENPFGDSVNPVYFYKTESHGDALEQMMMTVTYNISLGLVTGASGSGKTLVTQILLQSLDRSRYEPALLLVTPGMSKTGLLRETLGELGVALPVGIPRTQHLLKLLGNYVIDLHEDGRRLVLIIDECHFLSSENLHILRTISNIEIPECKLVTCLLFGESHFAKRLKHPSYASLRSRMYFRRDLAPMSREDSAQYVKYRLMTAGRLEDLFTEGGLTAVHEQTGGVCRNVNQLCMLTLIEGARENMNRLDETVVGACAEQSTQ